jgi:hypothetical protein
MSDPRRIITRANPSTTPPGYEFDALDHATHEDGCPIGRGSTPLLAVRDLLSYFSQTTLEQISHLDLWPAGSDGGSAGTARPRPRVLARSAGLPRGPAAQARQFQPTPERETITDADGAADEE